MKTVKLSTLLMMLALLSWNCGGGGTTGEEAETGEAVDTEAGEKSGEAGTPTTYTVDTDASKVMFQGTKKFLETAHPGQFPVKSGQLMVANEAIVGGTFTMDVAGMKITDENLNEEMTKKLKGHLKGGFFVADQYPTAEFEIAEVSTFTGEAPATDDEKLKDFVTKNPTHEITGNLTLKDSTKSITFPANVSISGDQVNAKAAFLIDRTKWGVNMLSSEEGAKKAASQNEKMSWKDMMVKKMVGIRIDLTATKESPSAE